MRRSSLTAVLTLAVIALVVINWQLIQRQHVPSHDPQALSTDTFARVAHDVLPSTATIYISGENPILRARMEEMLENGDPNDPGMNSLPHWMDPSELGRSEGSGSGVVVTEDGHIVTNHHLFANVVSPEIEVHMYDGRVFGGSQVELVASDRLTDLAVIKVRGFGFDPVTYGNSDRSNIGDWVLAIGNPLDLENTVTQGIISAKFRDAGQGTIVDFIQSSAHIEPGSSGGALMNISGELIGINSAIATTTNGWEGIGFSLPSNTVREVVDALIEHGHVPRGFIGIQFDTDGVSLPTVQRRMLGYAGPGGVLVRRVTIGGPSEMAGILTDDIIHTIAGLPIGSGMDLLRTVAALDIGKTTEVEIWRGDPTTGAGHHVTVDLLIAERPSDEELVRLRRSGMTWRSQAPEESISLPGTGLDLNSQPMQGRPRMAVIAVRPGSPADAMGFEMGDLILGVNGVRTFSTMALFAAIRLQAPEVRNHTFLVEHPDGTQEHITLSDDVIDVPRAPEMTTENEGAM